MINSSPGAHLKFHLRARVVRPGTEAQIGAAVINEACTSEGQVTASHTNNSCRSTQPPSAAAHGRMPHGATSTLPDNVLYQPTSRFQHKHERPTADEAVAGAVQVPAVRKVYSARHEMLGSTDTTFDLRPHR